MKVIHLISGGDTGGAKTHVHSLLRGLNQHIQADIICFTDGPFVSEARELGIRVDVIPGGNPISVLNELKARIRAEGYDIIHCHGARGNLMGALLQRSTGLPVVSTVHSDPKLDYMGRPLAAATFGVLNGWALRAIRYHIGVSDAMADLLIDRGLDPQQIFAIYNGVDLEEDHTPKLSRREFLASLGLDWPEDAVIVGIAARLNPVKDIPTLLRGFAAAHAVQPRLRLIVAGDGPEEVALRQLAEELGVADAVCFAGWLTDTDSFYNALDVNALTSLSETFSYAVTEGARFSLPIVSTAVGGIPYLVEHAVNGYLFQPGDHEALGRHLAALAADPSLRRRLGGRLLETVRAKYTLDRTIRDQLDIYETILRRHSRPKGRDGVVLCGAYGQNNAGDEAVLRAILGELRAIDPDMPLWVMTRKPKEVKRQYRAGAVYTFNIPGFCRRMAKSRLYVNGGGSLIQDVTSRRSLWFYLFTLSAARRLGCRVMMYGCGIGPVNSPDGKKRAARVISKGVDAITLRDQYSIHTLRELGVSGPEIVLAADPALTLPAAPRETADALLRSAGLAPEPDQRYLGITVRPWPGFEDKAAEFAAAAEYAYEALGLIPVFLPIVGDLDTEAARTVAARIQKAPYAILPACSRTEDTIALFARMEVVLSMRLHALIFAAGQGVPVVGAVYDPKVSAFLDELGQDLQIPFGQVSAGRLIPLLRAAAERAGDKAAREAGTAELLRLEANNSAMARKLLEM